MELECSSYARVLYEDVYSEIDLVFYRNEGRMEFDFIVAPGANPNAITLELSGEDKLEVAGNGDLVIGDEAQGIRFQKPVVYQEIDGRREEISGRYVLAAGNAGNEIRFQVGAYETSRPLVVDPVFVYSSYFGGSGNENSASGSELKD